MSKELYFLCEPVQFKPGIKIYPPTVKEVITNERYAIFGKLLTYSQEDIEDEFLEAKKTLDKYPTPIEFMLNNSYHNQDYHAACKAAFEFFIHEEVTFLYEQKLIVIGNLKTVLKNAQSIDDLVLIKEEEFFNFQNAIRECIGKKPIEPYVEEENPTIAEMKRKARRRDRLKEKQAAKNKGSGISLYTMMVSICCMGIGITPLNIGEMSYIALESLMRKYQEKEKYDLDIKSLLAGADSKKIKPQYWIRNFDE